VIGTSGPLCSLCEAAGQKAADTKFRRRQKAEREAAQKHSGGRVWRWR
jgi:hypothetical protein